MAVAEDGSHRILGRLSTDIIKTGGYKISALEIEEVLRTHPMVTEVAVVGIEDPQWGERVCAAMVLKEGEVLSEAEVRKWGKKRMAPYKTPSKVIFVNRLPRNAMGKVTKPDVKSLFSIIFYL